MSALIFANICIFPYRFSWFAYIKTGFITSMSDKTCFKYIFEPAGRLFFCLY